MRSQVSPVRVATLCVLAGLAGAVLVHQAIAATATGSFQVRITIQESCAVVSTNMLDFGSQNVLTANVDQDTQLSVQCTASTPYDIGLNAGTGAGATEAVRKMAGPGAATVSYSLYQDAGRSVLWGNTVGTNTISGTGTGAAQPYTVHGRVPPQTTPGAGTYIDTITVTVTF